MYKPVCIGIVVLTPVLYSVRIYEQYLQYEYKITQLYFIHSEKYAQLFANHDRIMKLISARREINKCLIQIICTPFVVVGTVFGVVERSVTTAERIIITFEAILQYLVPCLLALTLIVILNDLRLKVLRLRKK
jgi:hypothetical protein